MLSDLLILCVNPIPDSMDYMSIPQSLPIWYPDGYTWCTVGSSAARVNVFRDTFPKSANYWTTENVLEVKESLTKEHPSS